MQKPYTNSPLYFLVMVVMAMPSVLLLLHITPTTSATSTKN